LALFGTLLLAMGITAAYQYRTQTVPKSEYIRLKEECRNSKTTIL
jgi:hypothetical protein